MTQLFNRPAALTLAGLATALISTPALADDYTYDIGLSYGSSSTTSRSPLLLSGGETFGLATSRDDSDAIEISGTWYYAGLSDDGGPRSRAAFLSRASGVSLAYSYDDTSSRFSSTGVQPPLPPFLPAPIPPSSGRGDGSSNSLSANLRHVWKETGWYALAGASTIDGDADSTFNGSSFSSDFDITAYTLGVGRYFGRATAVDLNVVSTDLDGFDTTVYALGFSHLGSLNETWQYAVDLGYADSDERGDDGSYSLGFSLFPSNDFEFGLNYSKQKSFADSESYGAFIGWFARENVEIRGSYGQNDIDLNVISDFDSDSFSLGVNVRF